MSDDFTTGGWCPICEHEISSHGEEATRGRDGGWVHTACIEQEREWRRRTFGPQQSQHKTRVTNTSMLPYRASCKCGWETWWATWREAGAMALAHQEEHSHA